MGFIGSTYLDGGGDVDVIEVVVLPSHDVAAQVEIESKR